MPASSLRPFALVALLAPAPALAGVTMGGGTAYWEMNYGSCGTWWNGTDGLIMEDPSSSSSSFGDNDFVSSSDPWTQVSVEYDYGGTSYASDNNDGTGTCDWTMSYEYADSSVGWHIFSSGPLDIIRYESLRLTWRITGSGGGTTSAIDYGTDHIVWYEVWNQGAADVTNAQVMVALNPDVDVALGGSANTINDVENVDTADGYDDWAGAIGSTGMTIGFAPCDPETASIGFGLENTDPDTVLSDPDGANADRSVHFTENIGTIAAGQAASFGFVLGMGSDDGWTRDYAVDGAAGDMSFEYCDCDVDQDGFTGGQCGGSDCDDNDANVHPGMTDIWYDGVDSDCGGDDDDDADGDGWTVGTGGDCDDTDAGVNPGETETWYDGVDSDCDGADDDDADGDGFAWDGAGGTDCDDGNADVNPSEVDIWYDGVDEDCSGSDYDADGDGHDHDAFGGDDCDDDNDDINPSEAETWYDGVDSDCGGDSDYDADGDGHDHDAFDGDDCDDGDPDVHPGAEELWYDGIDQDCDEATIDDDQDGDGHTADEDCDDTDASIWDGCEEPDDDGGDDSGLVIVEEDGGGAGGGGDADGWKTTGGHGECGCASTEPARAPWALGLLGLVGIAIRRQR